MPLYRYRLIDRGGLDLGPFVSSNADWRPGETIPRAAAGTFRVTAVVDPEPGTERSFRAYLVVEQLDPGQPNR